MLNATLTSNSTVRTLNGRVTYQCEDGLTLRGDPGIICQAGFVWSKINFRCASEFWTNNGYTLLPIHTVLLGLVNFPPVLQKETILWLHVNFLSGKGFTLKGTNSLLIYQLFSSQRRPQKIYRKLTFYDSMMLAANALIRLRKVRYKLLVTRWLHVLNQVLSRRGSYDRLS